MRYEVRVSGRLPAHWDRWCDGFSCTLDANGESVLAGRVADQTALLGLLTTICHMNLTLVSVIWMDRH